MQAVLLEVDDDDVALDKPLYQCQVCKGTQEEAPEVTGRLMLDLKSSGSVLQAYASKALVKHITGGREPAVWGDSGSEQRLSLRNMLNKWESGEYLAALNTAPAKNGIAYFVSALTKVQASSKRARV